MPGLSQLKQFNKDILSIGDEITIRASRGEKPVLVPIPAGVKDVNDSEDFVLGMPENPAAINDSKVDEDLSDLTGMMSGGSGSSSKDDGNTELSYEAPDLSSLLSPVDIGSADSEDSMPDLSMFMDEPVEEQQPEEEIVEEAPQISVADMSLEALLAGAGFDGTEGTETKQEPEAAPEDDFISEIEALDSVDEIHEPEPVKDEFEGFSEIEKAILAANPAPEPAAVEEVPDPFSTATPPDLFNSSDMEIPTEESPVSDETFRQDFGADFDNGTENFGGTDSDNIEDIDVLEELEDLDEPVTDAGSFDAPDDFAMPDSSDFDSLPAEDFSTGDFDSSDSGMTDVTGDFTSDDFGSTDFGADDFDSIPAADFGIGDFGTQSDSFDAPEVSAADNFDVPEDLGAISDFEPVSDFDSPEDFGATETSVDTNSFDAGDFGSDSFDTPDSFDVPDSFGTEDLGSDDFDSPAETSKDENFSGSFNVADLGDIPVEEVEDTTSDFSLGDMGSGDDSFGLPDIGSANLGDFDASTDFTSEIPEFEDDTGAGDSVEDVSIETFDTTGMEDMDFGISEAEGPATAEESDDFSFGDNDFEIPGFSDVTEVKENKHAKKKAADLDTPDFSGGIPGNELPPNTLSDEQYKLFQKNFSEYPLNVRLAFEDLIVQDEFTDDAEFEIIEKILKKAPARQVASTLEKMLDTSIPVPRDYEHRTAEEYEAYKKSIQYQLKNKVLPFALCLVMLFFVGWGMLKFATNCIYKPLKANSLYKQGYALLEIEEYPQAEVDFIEATTYRFSKKWFFKYARGYRNHKQYHKSAEMYERILRCFNHDKVAGLEYAEMEMNDLANYEKAEEIVRRQVLDYHVNDVDADLMLGDIFLEWGTEKEPAKLEDAYQQYQKLLFNKPESDLYNSRIMRYFIRKDSLLQVLNYKERFIQKEKSLEGCDWTELSGYLLEKLYGPLPKSDEALRYKIEDTRKLLLRAVKLDADNPVAYYNLGNYYVHTNEIGFVEDTLNVALDKFNKADRLKTKDIYKYIDTYRLLGENFIKTNDVMRAQEQYTNGITLYTTVKEKGGFAGNQKIGLLYSDLADINYFASNDYENALINYKNSVDLGNDNSQIRYRIGYINYKNKNYQEALYSFIKSGEGNIKERNLMLAMGNTLSLKDDYLAAEGYYYQLISKLDDQIRDKGIVFPQASEVDNQLVTTYLYAANNYGVTLYKLAKRTGDSSKNGQALVQLGQSIRAWDALTRNQTSMVRLEGSNLAQENLKYITHPVTEFEPAIYIDIPKTLTDKERLR
ncbi:MAG: hypothetical protein MJ162_00095 [Treponema sp.]|nr:hypothetical protein [Treponema sp.]